jgi:ATP-binding cassette subfamily A (ABC1) protein 3
LTNTSSKFYDNRKSIDTYVESIDYNEDICFGVIMEKAGNGEYSYQLMYNTSGPNDDYPDTLLPSDVGYKKENKDEFYTPWINEGVA